MDENTIKTAEPTVLITKRTKWANVSVASLTHRRFYGTNSYASGNYSMHKIQAQISDPSIQWPPVVYQNQILLLHKWSQKSEVVVKNSSNKTRRFVTDHDIKTLGSFRFVGTRRETNWINGETGRCGSCILWCQ